jgi:hypothetical protein
LIKLKHNKAERQQNMKKINLQKVMEWLSYVLRCPVCGYKYNLERTKIIDTKQEEEQANLFVHSDCGQCKSSVVFNISINGPDVFSIGMITDLTSGDTRKFSKVEPLSANDVLDLHSFLKEFDGDFVKAIK